MGLEETGRVCDGCGVKLAPRERCGICQALASALDVVTQTPRSRPETPANGTSRPAPTPTTKRDYQAGIDESLPTGDRD